ncbi:MAG TPA: preprotein translocase subunit SecE [Candidatus Omnitrophota bacterium]|nr:preprotein translocase subunit SecE [Candidatus Omnitrophota bacterium]
MQKITKFMSQVRTEMEKVNWPTKDEMVASTVIVIISTLLLGAFIGICDFGISRMVNLLIGGVS